MKEFSQNEWPIVSMLSFVSRAAFRGVFQRAAAASMKAVQTKVERKQHIAKLIYSLWTQDGAEVAGLAKPLLDGRCDACALYVMGEEEEEDDKAELFGKIDRVHCWDLSYEDFYNNYMLPNRPVIIQGLTEKWKSRRLWVTNEGTPNIEYLRDSFGEDITPVFEQMGPGFSSVRPVSTEMSVADYCQWWQNRSAEPATAVDAVDETLSDAPLLYLKDYKFFAAHPASYEAYEWPHYFRDDWLNNAMGNAYKFVYLGPKGTSTVLHADVLRSFSWSANLCGQKRWFLVPPAATHLLHDCFGNQLAGHLHVDIEHGLGTFFPGLPRARKYAIKVDQQAGDTIFVPSNWYHTVENTQDTLSINHNWLNGANIRSSWRHVESQVRSLGKSQGHVNPSSETASTDNSGVDDDLILLYHVLNSKAQSIFKSGQPIAQGTTMLDLESILAVLNGLSSLIKVGLASEHVFQSIAGDVNKLRTLLVERLEHG